MKDIYKFLDGIAANNTRQWLAAHDSEYRDLRARWIEDLDRLIACMSMWHRQKENDSHPGAGDRAGKAEAGASGQAVRPVPVRVSPAGGNWEACGGVPQPAVPRSLSAGKRPAGQPHHPAHGADSGPTGRVGGADSDGLYQ